MKCIERISELKEELKKLDKNISIGLVPTMGALHDGHLALIKKSTSENDFTVVSVFVNPIQFGPNEDYEKYPRTLQEDLELAKSNNVDIVFHPSSSEMYKNLNDEHFLVCPPYNDVNKLCGKTRLGHFDGVCTIVSKLFNIIKPNRAYFGKKDAQQLFIIKKMVEELNFDIEIVPVDIVRESDGLALSSRNKYLDENARKESVKLSKALFELKKDFESGINSSETLIDRALSRLVGVEIDYLEILDLNTFEKCDKITKDTIVLGAVKIENQDGSKVRLIDNLEIK